MARIVATFSPECLQMLREFKISKEHVETTLNVRNGGHVVTRWVARVLAFHWFRDDWGVFVDSSVTNKDHGATSARVHEVRVDLAIVVRPNLPAGQLRQREPGAEWMHVIARSFGLPIVWDPTQPPDHIYSGGSTDPRPIMERAGAVQRLATYQTAEKLWDVVWFFDLTKYREWYRTVVESTPVAAPEDDDWVRNLRAHVLEIPTRYQDLVAGPNGYRWAVANSIIRFALGDEWWRRNFIDETAVIPQANNMRGMLRSIALGELLLNLRHMHGVQSRIAQMRTADLDSVLRELDTAQLVVRSGLSFRFNEPTAKRGHDFEGWIRLPSGRLASCEVKNKIDDTALTEKTIVNTLKKAVGQVPADHPAVFFLWLPNSWITDGRLAEILARATKRLFADSARVLAVEVVWESWRELPDEPGLVRWTQFREYISDRCRFSDPRDSKLLRTAPMLDPKWKWTSIDEFIVETRQRANESQPRRDGTE